MSVTALIIYILWAAIAFGMRSIIQRHRTGDSGLRNAGRLGSLQWSIRILFITALAVGATAPILDLVNVIEPVGLLDSDIVQAFGTVIAVIGVAATFATQLAMGASWRVGVDPNECTELVTMGPFAVVRNPIFTAMAATATGLALMVPNPIALMGIAVVAMAIELQVRVVEEPYLRTTHGRAYADYAAQVGRFMPGIGQHRPTYTE